MSTNNFLKDIDGNKTLNEITIPGSHDAGVYEDDAKAVGLGWKTLAVCQTGDLRDQCDKGSRFFDLRINSKGLASHTTAGSGAVGGELGKMMRDVGSFLVNNPSEFVILRFSKCADHKNLVGTLTERFAHILYKGSGNIARTKLSAVRGKAIAVFSTGEDFKKYIDPKRGILPFKKHSGSSEDAEGLVTCGAHTGVVNIEKVMKKQLEMVHAHDTHTDDGHLSVLYWTQTGSSNIKGSTTGNAGTHTKTATLMQTLKQEVADAKNNGMGAFGSVVVAEKLKRMRMAVAHPKMPNVVMYDFVNAATSGQIIELNNPAFRLY